MFPAPANFHTLCYTFSAEFGSGEQEQKDTVKLCPVVVHCDEKRQLSCRARKLAWRITDTQQCYIAQVSKHGSCFRRKKKKTPFKV